MNKKLFWIVTLLFLVAGTFAQAQQPRKIPRLGFLSAVSAFGNETSIEAFRQGLREFGYIEGKTIIIDYRWGEGKLDRIPELATELVNLRVDICSISL